MTHNKPFYDSIIRLKELCGEAMRFRDLYYECDKVCTTKFSRISSCDSIESTELVDDSDPVYGACPIFTIKFTRLDGKTELPSFDDYVSVDSVIICERYCPF